MTRKDYILIARALIMRRSTLATNEHLVGSKEHLRQGVLLAGYAIADELVQDNPHFNREHFLAVVRGEKALTSRPPR